MVTSEKVEPLLDKKTKKKYIPPEIKEVWNEEIGMTGAYLLEM